MRLFKTRMFDNWAAKEGLTDRPLQSAVEDLAQGIADALGGHVYKKRVALPGRGKRGGARTLLAYKRGTKVFFIYGFSKGQRANIKDDELKSLKLLAKQLLGYRDKELEKAVKAGELIEVKDNG